jgi:phosphoenolpyruvate synthase/pyruvate phosphate dikinase
MNMATLRFIRWFRDIGIADVGLVGGKNASLGEIEDVIRRARACGRKIGICGQAPSDYPEFARFLVRCGIDSISLNPDRVLKTMQEIAHAEHELDRAAARPLPALANQ